MPNSEYNTDFSTIIISFSILVIGAQVKQNLRQNIYFMTVIRTFNLLAKL